ncbi:MAG: cytochrome c biogenesis protein ResB [Bacteroidales bacterium]|nr:cytochrome c biogenesis protein ResB [Bacteroidales bacterium]
MWTKPWKTSEGFLIAGGLFVFGIALQIAVGPVRWSLLAAPANYIALLLLLCAIALMYILRKKVYLFEWMMHGGAAVSSIACALGITMVMGLLPQMREGGVPWLSQMLSFWPFVLLWMWMMLIAALATLNHMRHFKWSQIPFLLNHLGVVVAVAAATFGNADMQKLKMRVYYDSPQWIALSEDDKAVEPGIGIELNDFTIDYYEDMSPKRFASEITVNTADGQKVIGTVEVNNPLKVSGWKIYQYGYDKGLGSESPYSIFMLVKDPWLPAVYTGIFMMLAGALCLMLFMAPKPIKEEEEF